MDCQIINSVEIRRQRSPSPSDTTDSYSDGDSPSPVGNHTDNKSSCSDNDEGDNDFFEGPEKTLEVIFHSDYGDIEGLRKLSRWQIDTICRKAKCTVLTKTSNKYLDAYVLSESSLFVYSHKLVMKTCGTTTLLRCLSTILHYADKMRMELLWVGYSRKNLTYPGAQLWPHSSFGDEIEYISSHEKLQSRLNGTGHILGPVTGDHWFLYVADHLSKYREDLTFHDALPHVTKQACNSPTASCDKTINLMMFDMDPEVSSLFYKSNGLSGKEMTMKSGINSLCPGAVIDETAFEPCGYSMNAILHDSYSTIHITPQKDFSYVSFETNAHMDNYSPLVRNTLTIFRPRRFVLTMFLHGDSSSGMKQNSLPTDKANIQLPMIGRFNRVSVTSTQLGSDLTCVMACYTFQEFTAALKSSSCETTMSEKVKPTFQRNDKGSVFNFGHVKRERGHSIC